MSQSFAFTAGDRREALEAELILPNGQAADLSDATEIRFYMRRSDGTLVIDRPALVVPPSETHLNWRVWLVWNPGETDVPGRYTGQFRVIWSDGRPQTFPNSDRISIRFHAGVREG